MNTPNWKTVISTTGSTLLQGISKVLLPFKKINKDLSQSDSINEVLFYGAEDDEKKHQVGLNNLFCIYYVIVHASRSVDVCLPSLISNTISKCLITVRQNNSANIRVAIHNSDDRENLQILAKHGISVKIINSTVKLEHEFILVDAYDECQDAVAVFGSLDYEMSRVNCNRDTTLLTSERIVVLALKKEFDRVWSTNGDVMECESDDEKIQ
ncbi:unnamed protein product [Parnassius apollo]|uniref:(apollo) hypothetical protein n=1 Tax=Parnassius apollo TaxID=110799 RepID=A0A8S3WSE0_PARAO|nr:unnamed protein product [Parnassius apollo]